MNRVEGIASLGLDSVELEYSLGLSARPELYLIPELEDESFATEPFISPEPELRLVPDTNDGLVITSELIENNQPTHNYPELRLVTDNHEAKFEKVPQVIAAHEMEDHAIIQKRAAALIGSALAKTKLKIEVVPEIMQPENLMQSIQLAALGDENANRIVDMSCLTDSVERVYKSGIVIDVELDEDEDGELMQNNQRMDSIHENTLIHASNHPVMLERAKIETVTGQVLRTRNQQELLETHVCVVFSAVTRKVSPDEAKDLGFYTDTWSCSIQATSKEANKIKHQSAMVAGCEEPETQPFDIDAIVYVASLFGIDFSGLSPEEILARPLFIPKSMMPNGVVDIVKLYDDYKDTFFGHNTERLDYVDYMETCKQRIKKIKDVAKIIKKRLIEESASIKTPIQAVQRLNKISEEETLQEAVTNTTIDPNVFGPDAAPNLIQARMWHEQGNWYELENSLYKAKETAKSSSCPSGLNRETLTNEQENTQDASKDTSCPEVKDGQIVRCPDCREIVRAIVPSKNEIYCSNGSCKLAHPKLKKERR